MVERPAPLSGNQEEQLREIYEYLCRLADALNAADPVEELLSHDCGTGVPLRDQFKAMKNIYGGNNNG